MLQVIKSKNGSTTGKPRKKSNISLDKGEQDEIVMYVRKIRTLIEKLPPRDRQDYFSGLLNHILSDNEAANKNKKLKDMNKLSKTELVLLNELSIKMEELYRTMDYNPYI